MQYFSNVIKDHLRLNKCLTMLSKSQLDLIDEIVNSNIRGDLTANVYLNRPYGIVYKMGFPLEVKPRILRKALKKLIKLNNIKDPEIEMFSIRYSLTKNKPYIVVSYSDLEDIKVFI